MISPDKGSCQCAAAFFIHFKQVSDTINVKNIVPLHPEKNRG